MFIECYDKKRVVPLRACAQGLVDRLRPGLAGVDGAWRVHGIEAAALRKIHSFRASNKNKDMDSHLGIDITKLREIPSFRIGEQVSDRLHVGSDFAFCFRPAVKFGIRVEASVEVIDPSDIVLRELLENRTLGKRKGTEAIVV